MNDIKKIELDNDKIFLKKNKYLGWKVVYPIRNENYVPFRDCDSLEHYSKGINWFNLFTGGSWFNLILVVVVVLIVLGFLYEYVHTIKIFLQCFDNPVALENCKIAYAPDYAQLNFGLDKP